MRQKIASILLLIMVTATLVVATSFQSQIVFARPGTDDPIHIHLTYRDSPASTTTVSWQTAYSSSGDNVLYDVVSRGGDPSQYSFAVTGSHHSYNGASGYIHDVELTNLTPGTTYYFICGGQGNYSAERAFKTAPSSNTEFSFVIGGDSRGTANSEPAMRSQVSQAMSKFSPSFVLHVGDMVNDGNNQTMWDTWFADVDSYWIGANGLTIPVIPTLGNHENNSTKYYEQFALSGNEQWYYYDWGPTLRVIVLNSAATLSQISVDQVNWLESILSSTPKNTWKIVMFHNNVYYAGGHGDERNLQQLWVPIFDKYHVDVVVEGHEHLYHRTKPLNHSSLVPSSRDGTTYLTTGGWGAPLHNYNEQWYSAFGQSVYHFVLATAYLNGSLHFEAKGIDGKTFDELWLHSPLKYWDFSNGMHVRVENANFTQPPILMDENLTVAMTAPEGMLSTLYVYCGNRGMPVSIVGLSSWRYDNASAMMIATDIPCNGTKSVLISWSLPETTEPDLSSASATVIYGFLVFLAAGSAVSAFGVIRQGRRTHKRGR